MKKNMQVKVATAALVILATALLVVATAGPAFADDEPLLVEQLYFYAQGLQVAPATEPQITDGGDWEMGVQPILDGGMDEICEPDEGPFPDAGSDEAVAPEEFPEDDEPITDGGAEEVVEQAEPEPQVPQQETTVETETPEPQEPETDDEPTLPFTGGNATPYAIGGLLMALAGVGVLIARRRSFEH